MPYLDGSPASEAAKAWYTVIKNALSRRLAAEALETPLKNLKGRFPLRSNEIASVLLGFRDSVGSADDILLFSYIRLFLRIDFVNTADLLIALLRTSAYGPGNDRDPAATRRIGLPSCEEKLFSLLTQAHLHSALPDSVLELYRLVGAIADWLRIVSEYETRKQLEGAGLHHVDWFACGMYEALGSLAISVFENQGFREAGKQKWWKERRPAVVREMESYDVHILQWTQSQIAGRLRHLTGMPPFIGTDDKGRPLFTDQQVLDAIPQVPTAHSRAGLFLWMNAALAARPLADDVSMLSYLHARYPGNVQSLIVDLLVASFDNLVNSMLRKEPRQSVKIIRSFICNKVPVLISMLSGSIAQPMTAEACIQMALAPGGLISMNPLPPISAGASDVQESLKNTRLEFLQACALHGLVTENAIATILHEAIALPRVAKYNKDALVSQCANNISRMEALIDDLGAMQGNAAAIAGCVVQTINNLCMSRDTMSLKTVCNELIKRMPLMDIIMQYTEPGQLLLPLCNILDGWIHDQDQTEFTPSYEEFASILLLTLAVIHRYDIHSPDLDLLADNFISRLLDEMSSSKPPVELPEEHSLQLEKWIEGLFAVDEHGETSGIGDDVMRQCSPRDFYLLVPTLFEQSVLACRCNALSLGSFKGGLELLLEPFLLPSLVMGLGWLAEHSWEDHNDVEVLLQVLEKLLKPSSSSQDTQAMHRAILCVVATPLHNSLQALHQKRPDKKQVTDLSNLLKPYLNQQRNLHCSRMEMDEWMQDGTLKDRVRHSIQDMVRWASTTTNPPDPPPRYAHKMFALACQIVDTDMLLNTIVEELATTPFANLPVALDVCTAMICAPAAGSISQQRNHSSGVTARLRNKIRLVPSDVPALLEKPKAYSQALIQLSRQVESQLAIAQMPPMAMPIQMQEQAADQMMQDLGLELPADIANVAPDSKLDLAGLEQQMDLSNATLSNATLSNATVRQLESLVSDPGAMDLDQAQILGNLNMDLKNDQQLNLSSNQEEDIFAGLDMNMEGLGNEMKVGFGAALMGDDVTECKKLVDIPRSTLDFELLDKMPYALKARNVLVTGGGRGLGAEVARRFAVEGCNIAINYVSSEAPAQALSKELQEKHKVKTTVIKGDGGVVADIQNCVQQTIKAFGGLDIIIGNAGFTKFSDFKDLDALSYEEWDKCFHTNVTGNHALLKEALPTFNKNPDGGVFIMTSSVAGKSLSGSSMAYSVTKAAQIHLMKCLANTQGPKVRVNAVLPGLLLTDWGNLYGEERINGLKKQAALQQETELGECADAYVMLAKNTSVTGQAFHVDSGLVVAHM